MTSRRAVALALALMPLLAAGARADRVARLDVRHRGTDNRASVVGFARAHVGETIGLAALVPMHVTVGSDPDRELRYGYDGPPHGRTLLRITGGFTLQGAVRHNQWHLERTYLVDGFFRVSRDGEPTPENGQVLELRPVEPPADGATTITDFAE